MLFAFFLGLVRCSLLLSQSLVPGMSPACTTALPPFISLLKPAVDAYDVENAACRSSCTPATEVSCTSECVYGLAILENDCHDANGLIYQEDVSLYLSNGAHQQLFEYVCFPLSCSLSDVILWQNATSNTTCGSYSQWSEVIASCIVSIQQDDGMVAQGNAAIIAGSIVTIVLVGLLGLIGYAALKWRLQQSYAPPASIAEALPMLSVGAQSVGGGGGGGRGGAAAAGAAAAAGKRGGGDLQNKANAQSNYERRVRVYMPMEGGGGGTSASRRLQSASIPASMMQGSFDKLTNLLSRLTSTPQSTSDTSDAIPKTTSSAAGRPAVVASSALDASVPEGGGGSGGSVQQQQQLLPQAATGKNTSNAATRFATLRYGVIGGGKHTSGATAMNAASGMRGDERGEGFVASESRLSGYEPPLSSSTAATAAPKSSSRRGDFEDAVLTTKNGGKEREEGEGLATVSMLDSRGGVVGGNLDYRRKSLVHALLSEEDDENL